MYTRSCNWSLIVPNVRIYLQVFIPSGFWLTVSKQNLVSEATTTYVCPKKKSKIPCLINLMVVVLVMMMMLCIHPCE
jgi:hypothetical protein